MCLPEARIKYSIGRGVMWLDNCYNWLLLPWVVARRNDYYGVSEDEGKVMNITEEARACSKAP